MPVSLRLAPILTALAPPLCWSCHGAAPAREPLCRGCRARLRFLGPEVTAVDGVPVWAAVAYEGPARDLVRGLKYRGAAGLAEALAAQMAANAPPALLSAADAPRTGDFAGAPALPPEPASLPDPASRCSASRCSASRCSASLALVPVPAAPARVRRRGFDQAALLAAALARRRGLPLAACLERRGGGVSQVGRGRGARQAALTGAIGVRSRPPAMAVLVDDVVTTGATVTACAAALRAAGCERMIVLAYARTPGR